MIYFQQKLVLLQVDRVIPVAGKEQMQNYGLIFSTQTGKNLRDGHLWFSIFARPVGSRFTCVQRVACCQLILWLNLLVNIMWYTNIPPPESTRMIELGPLAVSPAQVRQNLLFCLFSLFCCKIYNNHVFSDLLLLSIYDVRTDHFVW